MHKSYLIILVVVIVILGIYLMSNSEEHFIEKQYIKIDNKDIINEPNFPETVPECMKLCKEVNPGNNPEHIARCLDYCTTYSGFIQGLYMIPNKKTLYEYL